MENELSQEKLELLGKWPVSDVVHYRVIGPDCRCQGQTEHEFNHTALCGYVRKNVTFKKTDVTCKTCLKKLGVEAVVDEEKVRFAKVLVSNGRTSTGLEMRIIAEAEAYLKSVKGK